MNTPAFHARPRFPRGFRCASTRCGIKARGRDLSLFVSDEPCAAAAVFTRNRLPGAPILVGRELIQSGVLQAVVVNSRVANVGTGDEGILRARRMGVAAARELDLPEPMVLMSSTGVIGLPLPIEKIEAGLSGLSAQLQDDPVVGAEGIMTTDTHPKAISLTFPAANGEATLTAVGKGSGMIAPNMATMLVYLFTDAKLEARMLDRSLRSVSDRTFNMLSVDGDTSTSDTCVLMANGHAGAAEEDVFREALWQIAVRMTELLARDGEGANRLFRVTVTGAADESEARVIARSLVNSPLMKTMVNGGDPNVGRILMAIGKCFDCRVESQRLSARIGEIPVLANGVLPTFDEQVVRAALLDDPADVSVDLGIGDGESRAWGCDLSLGYIQENAAYYST